MVWVKAKLDIRQSSCICCFSDVVKISDMSFITAHFDRCAPLLFVARPINTIHAAFVFGGNASVPVVLYRCNASEVRYSIVGPVTINVINVVIWPITENQSPYHSMSKVKSTIDGPNKVFFAVLCSECRFVGIPGIPCPASMSRREPVFPSFVPKQQAAMTITAKNFPKGLNINVVHMFHASTTAAIQTTTGVAITAYEIQK